jgi:hypothetical protein
MSRRKKQRREQPPPNVNTNIMIADVPVKINFMHGDETLKEYEEVIDVVFDYNTAQGVAYGKRMQLLKAQGHSTESTLFTIASEQVKAQTQEILQALGKTALIKKQPGMKSTSTSNEMERLPIKCLSRSKGQCFRRHHPQTIPRNCNPFGETGGLDHPFGADLRSAGRPVERRSKAAEGRDWSHRKMRSI